MVSQRRSRFLSLWYNHPGSRLRRSHVKPFGNVKSLTNVNLVLHDSLYYVINWPRRDIIKMKLGFAFVILSIRGSICRACGVEKDAEPFPVVQRKNGFHEMCQWVVTIEEDIISERFK